MPTDVGRQFGHLLMGDVMPLPRTKPSSIFTIDSIRSPIRQKLSRSTSWSRSGAGVVSRSRRSSKRARAEPDDSEDFIHINQPQFIKFAAPKFTTIRGVEQFRTQVFMWACVRCMDFFLFEFDCTEIV